MGQKTQQSRAVWATARRQHGVVTRRQLLDLGFNTDAIQYRIERRRLHPVWRGVYAVGRPELSRYGWWLAAVLSCGPEAVLSDESAAALWELVPPERHAVSGAVPLGIDPAGPRGAGERLSGRRVQGKRRHPTCPFAIAVTAPPGHDRRRPGITIHRRRLAAGDVAEEHGIPVTSPVRTLIDFAAAHGRDEVEAAINAADRRDLIDPETLRAALDDRPPAPGLGRLRETLDRRTFTLTDSELERRFLRLARRAGLPPPLTQQRVNGVRVDFFWPELGLVVETDGLRYHRTPAQQARDRLRDQAHVASGLTPLRFTHAQVRYEPDRVTATLERTAARLRA